MRLLGPNGKSAKVKTGWIINNGENHPRLVTAFVDKEIFTKIKELDAVLFK